MAPVQSKIRPLVSGEMVSWQEFEERWNAHPEIKFAELIDGKVYMPPPVSEPHGLMGSGLNFLFQSYAMRSPGCKAGMETTYRMFKDAPQPDLYLRISESHGGKSRSIDGYLHGAPELIAEVCISSEAYDLREKKDLYRRAVVPEYITVLMSDRKLLWHRLESGAYTLIHPDAGVHKSAVFPGLWIDSTGLFDDDMPRCLDVLNAGLSSPEHAAFAAELQSRSKK